MTPPGPVKRSRGTLRRVQRVLCGLALLLLGALPGRAAQVIQASPNLAIPDANLTGVSTVLNAPNVIPTEVLVEVQLDHPSRGHIELELRSPRGTTAILHQRKGGTADDLRTTYPTLTVPETSMDVFRGENAQGQWVLVARDVFTGTTGTLESWKLTFEEAPVGATVQFSGTAVYQDREILTTGLGVATDTPIRFAAVEVFRTADQGVLGRGETDGTGAFSVTIPQGGTQDLGVRLYTRNASDLYRIEVKNSFSSGALYSLSVTGSYDTSTNVTQNVAATGDTAGGVFNIFDQAVLAFDVLRELVQTSPPKLTIFWEPGTTDGTYFTTLDSSVHLLGASTDNDAFDDDVILHEIGHFAHYSFSHNESPGGSHSPQEDHQDPRLAFSEGYANYFSASVRNDPELRDINIAGTSRFELETPSFASSATGQDNENVVGAVLWDVFDPGGEDPMALDDGASRVWKVLQNQFRSPLPTTLETFRNGWPLEHGADFRTQELEAILQGFRVDVDRDHLYQASPARSIPDQGEVVEFLSVPENLTIETVNVFVDIDHPRPEDLLLTLVSPGNEQVVLYNRGATPAILPSRPGDPGVYDWFQEFEQTPAESLSAYTGDSAIGTWQLRVQDTRSGQTGTFNNWSLDIRGNAPGFPDLFPVSVSGPGSLVGGGAATVSYTVGNEGSAASGAFQVRVVLSSDRTITAADTSLGAVQIAGLAAGAQISGSLDTTVPNLAGGEYTLGLLVDDLDQVFEGDETDNAAPSAASLTLTQAQTGTNLRVTSLTVPDSAGSPGSMDVVAEISNLGSDPAGPFRLAWLLSTDSSIELGDTLLQEVDLAGLAGASSVEDRRTLTLPAGLLEGSYTVGMLVDTGLAVSETDEDDNVAAATNSTALTRATSGVDLVAESLSGPSATALGVPFTVALGTRNRGTQASPSFEVSIFLSTDQQTGGGDPVDFPGFVSGLILSSSETATPVEINDRSFTDREDRDAFNALFGLPGGEGLLLGTITLSPLDPGQARVDNLTVSVPVSQPAGEYTLIASLDPLSQVAEANEENNVVATTNPSEVGVALLPDLIPTNLVAPTTVAQGQDISVTRTLTNAGGLATGQAFTESYYLVGGDSVQAGDVLLGSFSQAALAPGSGDVRTRVLSLPLSLPLTTTARFALQLDPENAIQEIREDNNEILTSATLPVVVTTATALPDLVPTRVAFREQDSEALIAGARVQFETTISNQGALPVTTGTRSRILLSTDTTAGAPPDLVLVEFDTAPIVPGGSQNLEVPVTLPIDLSGGDYYLALEADLDDRVVELNEANNSFLSTSPARVSSAVAGIDLLFAQVEEPFVATAGTSMTFDVLLVNRGTQTFSTPFFTRFYLSDDNLFDAGDRALEPPVQIPGMVALGQQSMRPRVDLPSTAVIGPGPFYLVAVADTTSQVAEVVEDNNALATTNSFSLSPALPELRITNLEIADPVVPRGGRVRATTFFENVGTASTGSSFSLRFQLYKDAKDASTLVGTLATFTEAELAVAEARIRVDDPVDMPSDEDLALGTYDLCVSLNAPQAFAEAGTAPNRFCRLGLVLTDASELPDYEAKEVSAPLAAFQGGGLRVSRRVDNVGATAATTSSTVGYFLSTDASIDPADLVIGREILPPLAGGANDVGSFLATVPSTTPPGTYYVGLIVDLLDEIGDGVPANNAAVATRVTTVYGSPDLVMESLSSPGPAVSGGQLQVDRTLRNIGPGDETGTFLNRYYLSLDTILDSRDFLLGVEGYSFLPAGALEVDSLFFDLPGGLSPGTYYLAGEVDATNLSREVDEGNNQILSGTTVTVVGAPDLEAISVSAVTTGTTGTPMAITGVLRNAGNVPVPVPFQVDFYLSLDGAYGASDPYIGTTTVPASLSPLVLTTLNATFEVPEVPPGDYRLYMEIDGPDVVSELVESQESNNVLDPTTLTIRGPDAQAPVPTLTFLDASTGQLYPDSDYIPAGTVFLQVDFGEPVTGPPLLALDLSEGPDLPPSAMTSIDPSGAVWRLAYQVEAHDGSRHFDGGREVTVSGARDLAGNASLPVPSGQEYFSVDTRAPGLLEPLTPEDRGTHPLGSMVVLGTTVDESPVEILASVDGGPFTTQVAFANAGLFAFTLALSGADSHQYQLMLRDRAGNRGLSPLRTVYTDADLDTLPDFWERQYTGGLVGLTPGADFDGDGLLDQDEFVHGTDPTLRDTDGDGLSDGLEVSLGSDPVNSGNQVPVAVAQADSVGPPRVVTLSGLGSSDGNGDPLTYSWSQVSGPVLPLSDPGGQSVATLFLASGTYVHQLVVHDGRIASEPALVRTVVTNLPPEARVRHPRVVRAGSAVLLDAGSSRDPNGDGVNHNWTEDPGNPSLGVLSNATEPVTTMVAIEGREGTYRFYDQTDDGEEATTQEGLAEVVVLRDGTTPPTADPGPDQRVPVGAPVTLVGSGSRDPEQALADLTFFWTPDPANPPGGSFVNPGPLGPDRPVFTAAAAGAYRFELRVRAGDHFSPVEEVWVVADSTGTVPRAVPGGPYTASLGELVVLDEGSSSGPTGQALAYQWTQVSGVPVELLGASTATPYFYSAHSGDYRFRLVVSAGGVASRPVETLVRVLDPGNGVPRARVALSTLDPLSGNGRPDDGGRIRLDASTSLDDDPLSYSWRQLQGPWVLLDGDGGPTPTLTPPPGSYVFEVTVSDGVHQDQARVSFSVDGSNEPPVVQRPADQVTSLGSAVTLSALGTLDPDGGALEFFWYQTEGLPLTFSGQGTQTIQFLPGALGSYAFELRVFDGIDWSTPSETRVTVQASTGTGTQDPGGGTSGTDPVIQLPEATVSAEGGGGGGCQAGPRQSGGPVGLLLLWVCGLLGRARRPHCRR